MAASEVIFEKTFANGWTKKLTKRLSHQKRRNTSLGPLIDPYITSPKGKKLRSSYELLEYVMAHSEYWYDIDISEINLERVHPDNFHLKTPCTGTKKLGEFLNHVRSGMSYQEAKERIGGNQLGKHRKRNSEDSNSSTDVGHCKMAKQTKCPKTKKRKTEIIKTAPSDEDLIMFRDFRQFPNDSADGSNMNDLEDSFMTENKKEFQFKLKQLMTSVIQFTDVEGRVISRTFMKLPSRKELPKYYKVIKKPMDISKIWCKIEEDRYNDIPDLERDFDLLCKNTQKYNAEASLIYQDSENLQTVFEEAKNKLLLEMLEDVSFEMDVEPPLEAKVIEDVEESEKLAKLSKRRGRPSKKNKMHSKDVSNIRKKKSEQSVQPLLYCKPCNYSTKIKGNMVIHEKSTRHKKNFEKPIMPTRVINTYPYSELYYGEGDPYFQVTNKIDPFLESFLQLDIISSKTVGRVIDFSEF